MTNALNPPRPENIGDTYRVVGYPVDEEISYGLAYKCVSSTDPSRWTWWIEMDDLDSYEWPDGAEALDILPATKIELVRRNVRPAREYPGGTL